MNKFITCREITEFISHGAFKLLILLNTCTVTGIELSGEGEKRISSISYILTVHYLHKVEATDKNIRLKVMCNI